MIDQRSGHAPFQAHVELLHALLAHRNAIVEAIQGMLNAQRKSAQYLQNRSILARHLDDCVLGSVAITDGQARLMHELDEAYRSSVFRPREVRELHNDLVDPVEMMIRGFYCWQQTRWPGRNGRVRYAHTLFNLYVLRRLELLSLRIWDDTERSPDDRLSALRTLLDELWRGGPADQPALVRDARWLVPLAQSPTTDELRGYFEIAERVAQTLSEQGRQAIRQAHVRMIGGHLRSQMRHYCLKDGVPLDDVSVVRRTRTSNALDFGLLIQHLVPLLEAYDDARQDADDDKRLELASTVFQGISADPELFVRRLDLLGAYSMIEHLFVGIGRDAEMDYTSAGRRHIELYEAYVQLMTRLAEALHEDCLRFKPIAGAYSPYGAIYGTPTNLVEDMALKTLQPEIEARFSLEDVFVEGGAEKLAWVDGWRRLPHVSVEVQRLYEYPQQFAEQVFARIERALRDGGLAKRAGRLILSTDGGSQSAAAAQAHDLPTRYVVSSDRHRVAAHEAEPCDEAHLLRDRQEGYFVTSYETSDGWVAIKKDMLTEVLGVGDDARLRGVPAHAAKAIRLLCPGLTDPA